MLLTILNIAFFANPAFAVTPTVTTMPSTTVTPAKTIVSPTTKPQDVNLLNQIDNLKEKIASKVAQLNLVEKRGIVGTVTDANSTQITLNDIQNNTRFIDVDEITNFSAPGKTSFGISDLTKGTLVSVLGLYNKDSRRILARFVDVVTPPTYLTGIISSIDKLNGQFNIVDEDKKTTLIDVEAITKTYSFTQATDMVKSGFSKLNVGDTVSIMGYPDKKTPSMIVANRIIQLLEVTKDPKIDVASPTTEPTTSTSPTAGSSASKK